MPNRSQISVDNKSIPLVAILAYPGVSAFELSMAIEIFELANLDRNRYKVCVCAESAGECVEAGLVRIIAQHGITILKDAHTIIIPGWLDVHAKPPKFAINAVRNGYEADKRIASICSGVFLLASARILDGKRAAVHWAQAALLTQNYPRIKVDESVLYIDEGNILTSAGRVAGMDMCLHIVKKDYGSEVMRNIARRLVIPAHREGGQTQFIPHSETGTPNTLLELCTWIRNNLNATFSIDELAIRSHMSRRTFIRRFHQATGLPPGEWLTRERIAFARRLLENTNLPVNRIAEHCGFRSTTTLRHHFLKRCGTYPAHYRAIFHVPAH